jgi:hypothetical protein
VRGTGWELGAGVKITQTMYIHVNKWIKNSIVHKYHIFLIHSSVVGHPGYFHNLAILNTTAISMGVQMPGFLIFHLQLLAFTSTLPSTDLKIAPLIILYNSIIYLAGI